MPRTVICAHRGLDERVPENTLAAFEAALKRNMAIEFDVQMTMDEQLVIMHDETVDRTTDGSGRVSQLSLADLKALDAGSWFGPQFAGQRVPTFDEALEVVRNRPLITFPFHGFLVDAIVRGGLLLIGRKPPFPSCRSPLQRKWLCLPMIPK